MNTTVFRAGCRGWHCGRLYAAHRLYNSTGGSLLATILWHGGYNAAVAGSEGVVAAALTAAVILDFILIVCRYGPEKLSHRPKQVLVD